MLNRYRYQLPYIRLYRRRRYRHWCTDFTEVFGAGIDVVPNFTEVSGTSNDVPKLAKCPVTVLMMYRTCRSFQYRYWWCTELTEMSGTGTRIDLVPKWSKYPLPVCKSAPVPTIPVSMSCRTYRSVWYRYWCRTELTEVSGTSNTGGIYRRYATLRTVTNTPLINLLPRNGWSLLHDYVPVRVYGRYRLDWG